MLNENENTNEIWVEIINYPMYHISNFGRIKSFKNVKGKILNNTVAKNGYKVQFLYNEDSRKQYYVHRLVALHFISNTDRELNCINHIDGNKLNNNYTNLEWCTKAQNNYHALTTGLINNQIGVNNIKNKLTEGEVKYIYNCNKTAKELSGMFNISTVNVYHIRNKRTWKYLYV